MKKSIATPLIGKKPMALVIWSDTMGQSGWGQKEADLESGEDFICRSVGVLVADTPTHVALALSECAHSYSDSIRIPRHAVIETYILSRSKRTR